jgi:EasF-like predicted methyltransferase
MPGIEICNASGCQVYDIRQQQEDSNELQAKIRTGISSTPMSLPSLLLWDEEGLRRFDQFADSGAYYLRDKEFEILQKRGRDIAVVIPTGSVLVELGCGSLQKTGQLLQALEKQQKAVRYYALDVSLRGLTDSLSKLSKELGNLSSVNITGLCGTYDDCVSWISTQLALEPRKISAATFLWMGNSVGNMDYHSEASALLAQFKDACHASHLQCQFLIAADACEDIRMIQNAYDTSNPTLHAFILNGLSHANAILGRVAFSVEDWSCESEFCPDQSQLEVRGCIISITWCLTRESQDGRWREQSNMLWSDEEIAGGHVCQGSLLRSKPRRAS